MSDNYENKNVDTGAEQHAEPPIESQIVKKKSLSRRIADALMSEDYKLIFKSIYENIVSPAIKKIAVEAFRAFVYRGKTSSSSYDEYTDYGAFHEGKAGNRRDHVPFRRCCCTMPEYHEEQTQERKPDSGCGLLQDCWPDSGTYAL